MGLIDDDSLVDCETLELEALVLELLGKFDDEVVLDILELTDEDGLREANPDGVTYVLAEMAFVGEYVVWVDSDCLTVWDTELVVDCVIEAEAD